MESFDWICPPCLSTTLPLSNTRYNTDNVHHVDIERNANRNSHKGVKCFLANARSLKNKFQDLHAIVFAEQFYVLAITETWFDPSVLDHEVIPSGYTIYRRDRQDQRGGGVLLAFCNNLMFVRRSDLETSCKLLWCEFTDDQGSKYLFAVFYRPPNTNVD